MLFGIAIISSFVDALAGGGGLLSIPALMMTGMSPLSVLGTNKLQASMGSITATLLMFKHKRVFWPDIKHLMLASCLGSIVGTIFIQFIDSQVLSFIIPFVLGIIAIYFLISPLPLVQTKSKISHKTYQRWIVPSIGSYDGMFGPGAGSFFILAAISLRGKILLKAIAEAKTLNFSSNIASLIVFLFAGQVVWAIGLTMMGGQVIGAWLGSHYLFKINPKYLRVLIVTMSLIMLAKYLWPT